MYSIGVISVKGVSYMLNLGMPELILILIIALIVFGPGKLPEVGRAIGRGLQEFRRASNGDLHESNGIETKPIDSASGTVDKK